MSGDAVIRRAARRDLPAILALKAGLALGPDARGGFLLGTSAETYELWLETAGFWVLEAGGAVGGFGICLGDAAFRASDVWGKRGLLGLSAAELAGIEARTLCYFEQLAVARGLEQRKFAAFLALKALADMFEAGHDGALATTVARPVTNTAAWPFLKRAGAVALGSVDEVYPGVGAITSDVHLLAAADFWQCLASLGEKPWFAAMRRKLGA